MEEEVFSTEGSFIRWPILQLYRNFVVVILNTFILNPVYKIILFIPVFAVFLFHDCKHMPYKHLYLNILQCLSSGCLLIIAVCNIPTSMTLLTNALSVPLMGSVVMAAQYAEMSTYVVVPMSLVVWKVWGKFFSPKRKAN